jgi:hypothetical protein
MKLKYVFTNINSIIIIILKNLIKKFNGKTFMGNIIFYFIISISLQFAI